jgi:beta-glucosidase
MAWYPGEQGGNAFGDILTGTVSPSGRLPITFYKSTNDLPDYTNYAMQGRTYRYFKGPVQYPFGYGLSYASFNYEVLSGKGASYKTSDTLIAAIRIQNKSKIDAAETVQAYIEYPKRDRMPIKELKFFKRVEIKKGQSEKVKVQIPVNELKKWDLTKNAWMVYPGKYKLILGKNAKETIANIEFEVK